MTRSLVCGAGGFIGRHLIRRLKHDGGWVRGIDLREPPGPADADEFVTADLRDAHQCRDACDGDFDCVYQLAADMGGAGYIFVGNHDADILSNSASINLNVLRAITARGVPQVFFPSSACVYPAFNQTDPERPICREDTVYPAMPDSEYGWEKLFAERLYLAHHRARRIDVRIARLHNVYGPGHAWCSGREKAPAAICRKVVEAPNSGSIDIWGDGCQTRSFLFIDDCIEAICRLMGSDVCQPVNVGSEEMVTIRELAELVMEIAGKRLTIRCVSGPQGVRGRTSDNQLITSLLGWRPALTLREGLARTYEWTEQQARQSVT